MRRPAPARTAVRRSLTVLAWAAAAASLLCAATAVQGARSGSLDWTFAMDRLLGVATPALAAAALALGLVGAALSMFAAARRTALAAGAAAAAGAIALLGLEAWRAHTASVALRTSPVHDVATDWRDPLMPTPLLARSRGPRALAVEAAPAIEEGPRGGFLGRLVAEENAATCPQARPLILPRPPAAAYARVRSAVVDAGLRLVTDDPSSGVLEAEAQAPMAWGARADVLARVRRAPNGARVDLRSVSRHGRVDGGANCRRVVALRAAIAG